MADESFKEFVLDQLGGLPEARVKAMFGGYGFYQGDRFFGILLKGRLYLKTDVRSPPDFLPSKLEPFTYEKGRHITSLSYFEVPSEILENREKLLTWAHHAVASASVRPTKPVPRKRRVSKARPRK
jgi:DNA transformation protein